MTDSLVEGDAGPPVDELERQATSAYLRGGGRRVRGLWIRAHSEYLRNGDISRAARCISWLVLDLFNRREWARGKRLARAQAAPPDSVEDCPAHRLSSVLVSRNRLREGDTEAAAQAAVRAGKLSRQFHDPDLYVFSRLALALVHARRGQPREVAARFDEIMVGVTVERVSPIAVGVVYCAVIDACRSMLDITRAREWTIALDRWCSGRPHAVTFRGKCLVHRATARLTSLDTKICPVATAHIRRRWRHHVLEQAPAAELAEQITEAGNTGRL